jgi:hypothetical protein
MNITVEATVPKKDNSTIEFARADFPWQRELETEGPGTCIQR